MGFFSKKEEGGMLDVIRCDEQEYLVWKWRPSGEANSTKKENAIRYGSSLRVKDGELAVFVYQQKDGSMQDFIVGPFDQTIKTANFPILSNIVGAAFGGSSPFQAEIYFINLAGNIPIKFGVPYFNITDSRLPDFPVPMSVRGQFIFNITDYKLFIKNTRLINFELDDFKKQIKDAITKYIKGVVTNIPADNGMPVLQMERKILEINESTSSENSDKIPPWVKNNADWWAAGDITESDFLSGITHLVKIGIISVSDDSLQSTAKSDPLLSECQSIKSTYKRLNCEKEIKQNLEFTEFKKSSDGYAVGSITYYYPGIGNFGNEFEISSSGQAMLRLRILAENNSSEVISLKCTGPSICNYDVWDGSKAFKYAGMDFISGQIPISPGTSIIFNMMFGPNIGYGGNQFIYDSNGNVIGIDKNNNMSKKSGKVLMIKALKLSGKIDVIGDGFTDYEIKKSGLASNFYAFIENINREKISQLSDKALNSFDDYINIVKE